MATRDFTEAWQQLSSIQQQAAAWDDGPIMVLAGPGSGKTRVLTCRIARILDSTSDAKFRILALTFTNKAADEMRDRVALFTPGQEARMFLGTFHAFCADILRQHGIHLGISPNFKIYALDSDLNAVLSDAVDRAKTKSDVVTDNDKKTLPVIQFLKANLVLPSQCRSRFKDPAFAERMVIVYPEYEAELSNRNALDFNSLVLRAHQLLSQYPVLAKRYRAVYPYICVDEFQDTNLAQYSLIRALTGDEHRNVFAVADDDQIIYQWNGASHQRIGQFVRDYVSALIQLPVNYRCPPEVVELANNLIQHNFLRTADKSPLQAHRRPTGNQVVRLLPAFTNHEAEAEGVAQDIEEGHRSDLGSVTVLARNRRLLEGVERVLRARGLEAVISQRKDEFQCPAFVWLHSMLRLANDRQDQRVLEAVCGTFAKLTDVLVDSHEVVAQAQAFGRDCLQQWVRLVRQESPTEVVEQIVGVTSVFLAEGRDFRTYIGRSLGWFETLARDNRAARGPFDEMLDLYEEERDSWLELERQITTALGDDCSLEAFLQELEMRSKEPPGRLNAVTLMTIHAAKGKEFKHVYLVGLVEDELPSYQSKQKGDDSPEIEEERRNCFVAITRTVETLTMSCAARYRGWRKEPSRFLAEMGLVEA